MVELSEHSEAQTPTACDLLFEVDACYDFSVFEVSYGLRQFASLSELVDESQESVWDGVEDDGLELAPPQEQVQEPDSVLRRCAELCFHIHGRMLFLLLL